MITTNTLPATSGKGRLITLWSLSGFVALAFVFVGGGKLAGTAAMVELFDKVGVGQWFRYLTGLLEVLENPLRRLLRKPDLTSTADEYRNSCHMAFLLLVVFKAFVTRR